MAKWVEEIADILCRIENGEAVVLTWKDFMKLMELKENGFIGDQAYTRTWDMFEIARANTMFAEDSATIVAAPNTEKHLDNGCEDIIDDRDRHRSGPYIHRRNTRRACRLGKREARGLAA